MLFDIFTLNPSTYFRIQMLRATAALQASSALGSKMRVVMMTNHINCRSDTRPSPAGVLSKHDRSRKRATLFLRNQHRHSRLCAAKNLQQPL